ncbi:hypothetical protein [Acetobacter sp.]|uniref:hypothetical protein n=1 Tax=Acetobacter sp. TaxID=440 RepID=UPI0025BA3062|nr:hypothetical protein [Acetobacter sp.]MCH4091332.1 hypothetical protein [Acetobacter sp.]MCI1299310.1 hypothetical protein [Acetobacter sp.]MCI1316686.1 hypothetical protein [Acetobacter sp.]
MTAVAPADQTAIQTTKYMTESLHAGGLSPPPASCPSRKTGRMQATLFPPA